MKRYLLAFLCTVCTLGLFAQSTMSSSQVKVGDIFEIGTPATSNYQHLDIPRPNTIIKRGGLYNLKDLDGVEVVVTSIKEQKDGTTKATIKPTNHSRFFGSHKYMKVDLTAALDAGELKAL